jgi:type III restriction enzyme
MNGLRDAVHLSQAHYKEKATGYEVKVSMGFMSLRQDAFTAAAVETPRDFRTTVEERQLISRMLFGVFNKCLFGL